LHLLKASIIIIIIIIIVGIIIIVAIAIDLLIHGSKSRWSPWRERASSSSAMHKCGMFAQMWYSPATNVVGPAQIRSA
jgi:flagellar basal body-associated protein FliL